MSNNEKPNAESSLPIHIQNLIGKIPFIAKNSFSEFLADNAQLTQSDAKLKRIFAHLGWDTRTGKFKQDPSIPITKERFIQLIESEYNFKYSGLINTQEKAKGSITPNQVILNTINNFDSNFSPEGDRLRVSALNLVP